MKVLLVWPKARTDPEWGGDLGAVAEPLCLEYIGAVAKRRGHEVQILDLRLFPDELGPTLSEFQPDIVGITAFSMHVSGAKAVATTSKAALPDCVTVVGGHHATLLPEDFFTESIDFVVSGEGTAKFGELLDNLSSGNTEISVRGVWSNPKYSTYASCQSRIASSDSGVSTLPTVGVPGEFVYGGEGDPFNIDEINLPDRSLTEEFRNHYFIDWMKPVALLRSTVGCPYRCTFCSLWKIMDGRYYRRDMEQVVNELASIKEDFVFLIDDEAFINGKRMMALADSIREAGIRKRFFAYCRIDTLVRNRNAVHSWVGIGLERLLIGIDAISGRDLEEYKKGCTIAQIEKGIAVAQELGVEIFAQFVVNTNYSKSDFKRLRRFVEHHKLKYPSFTVLTPLPGTDMLKDFSHIVERQPNGRPNWDLFDTQNAVTETVLPRREFRREYRNLYRVFKGSYSEFHSYHTMPGEIKLSERQLA